MEKYKTEIGITQERTRQAELKKEIQANMERLSKLTFKMGELKAQITSIKSMQLTYYHTLLREGTDSRQDGLVWIVKAIWTLGYNINPNKFPPFLDEFAVEFLLKYAKLDIEGDQIQREMRARIVEAQQRQRLREISVRSSPTRRCAAKSRRDGSREVPGSPSALLPSESSTGGVVHFMDKEVLEIERRLDEVKRKIKEMRQGEVARVLREFASNGYERKYNAGLKVVLAALAGENTARVECDNLVKSKAEYKRVSSLCSTFQFGGIKTKERTEEERQSR